MLEALHSVANPIPPPTVRVNQQPVNQSNSRHSILMSGLITGGLIGASVIISQVFKPSPEPVVNQEEVTPTVTETPVMYSPPVIQKNITSPVIQETVLPSPTTNSYLWLSERSVTDADLDDKDGLELDIMRNSIYARHGRRFDTPSLQEYFNNQSWYNPVYSPKAFPPKLLSNLEQRNAEYISKYQDRNQRRHFPK